jgi:hypothetical protein
VKERPVQPTPTPVPLRAKQAGEVRVRWAWSEASVWTDRMLAALEEGVKGDVWFSLIHWPNAYFATLGLRTLTAAHEQARQSAQAAH